MNSQFNGNGYNEDKAAGNAMPAFSGAFDDDSARPTLLTNGQPEQTQYIPPMYGQPMYGQPQFGQYAPPMYGQPVYYAPPVYIQQPMLPKNVVDRKLFRTHCSRVGLMLMADFGLMFAVQFVVLMAAIVILVVRNRIDISGGDVAGFSAALLGAPFMLAGGLSAIAGNMTPAALHLRKWNFKFSDPFRGDKLSPFFTLAALLTALGLNSAWCEAYEYLRSWFGNVMDYIPESSDKLYSPETMSLAGMILYLTWVCVIAPVTEEYMFRGAMLKTLSHYGSGFAIAASAFAFGLMHGNMQQTPMAFLIGLIMGYVASKSGNIRQTIFIHAANNTIASLPQIINYFKPEWNEAYENYIGSFDEFTMTFAAFALLYFMFRRSRGLRARRKRILSGLDRIRRAERLWLRLEVPDVRRIPRLDSVKHKFCHFVTSGGMIFFIVVCLLSVFIMSFLPYIIKQPIPGMGF